MKIEIRKITKKDKKAFIKLSLALTKFNQRQHDKSHRDFTEVLAVRKKRVEGRFNKLDQSPHLVIYMAFLDEKPVGYARAFTYDKKFRYGCLDELYLTTEARGHGIGEKLLNTAARWMAKRKVVRMIVSVYAWNAGARKFYAQEGFTPYAVSYEKKIPPRRNKQ